MKALRDIAPIQLLAIGFDEPEFKGRIIDELKKLREQNVIRLVDALAVQKEDDGSLTTLQVSDLPKGERVEYGAVIGYLIGLGSGDEAIAEETAREVASRTENEYEYGMNVDQVKTLAEDIPAGGAAIILLIEHLWALPLRQALRDAGGVLIAQDFLSPEVLVSVGTTAFQGVSG